MQMNCQAAMLPPCLTDMEKKDMDEKVINNFFFFPEEVCVFWAKYLVSLDFSRTISNSLKDI